VKVVDLNLLIYAVNRDAEEHARARQWLDTLLSGDETVGLPWSVLLGFLRLSTNARLFARPLRGSEAMAIVDAWLGQPAVVALSPGEEHWSILRSLLTVSGATGSLTSDAHLAALTIEHGGELCSADSDFRRFDGLRWVNPIA
jgi:uncharacterized protein